MITHFITEVTARFNPFSPRAKICRVFLSQFGPSTFRSIKFNNKVLPRDSTEPSQLKVKFRMSRPSFFYDPLYRVDMDLDLVASLLDRGAMGCVNRPDADYVLQKTA